MNSIWDVSIKWGSLERLCPKSCLIQVTSSYSAVLCNKECTMVATRLIAFIGILMHKVLSGNCIALGYINAPKDRLHTLKLEKKKKKKSFPSKNFK